MGIHASAGTTSALALDPRLHGDDDRDEHPSEARSAEAGPTGRRTQCALAERSRQAAGVSAKQTPARSAEARPTGRRTQCAPAERSRKAAGVSAKQNPARSAEARPTGRRTQCAPAERSRKAAGVSAKPTPARSAPSRSGWRKPTRVSAIKLLFAPQPRAIAGRVVDVCQLPQQFCRGAVEIGHGVGQGVLA